MPIIASHHLPGGWRHDPNFSPRMPWPDNCTVQWGGKGIVIAGRDSYETAFFEAFPNDNAGDFIRGEGRTRGEAELSAFAKYMREASCREHVWCRRRYKNGLGICSKCGAGRSGAFRPLVKLGAWREFDDPDYSRQYLGIPNFFDGMANGHLMKRRHEINVSRHDRAKRSAGGGA